MKKWICILIFFLLTSPLSAQIRIGIGTTIGESNIIPFRSGHYNNNFFRFTEGVSYSLSFSALKFLGEDMAFATGLGFAVLNSHAENLHVSIKGVESWGRISIPLKLYLLKDKLIGGFIGINSSLNIPLTASSLSHISVPFCISPCLGFSGLVKNFLLVDLTYSMDLNPFAQTFEGHGYFGAGTRPHYHFTNISLGVVYLFNNRNP